MQGVVHKTRAKGTRIVLSGLTIFLFTITVLVLMSGGSEGREIVVDEKGGGDYTDLGRAVLYSAAGDTIIMKAGNYSIFHWYEDSPDNLTIIGESRDTTHIVFKYLYTTIAIKSSNIAFRNINFTAEAGSSTMMFAYNGTGISFHNCTFHRISRVVIYYSAWNSSFVNNTFLDSDFYYYINSKEQIASSTILNNTYNGRPILFLADQDEPEIPDDLGGLTLINCTNVTIRDWEDIDSSQGIKLYQCTDVLIENCTIRSTGYPIDIGLSDNVTIRECTVLPGEIGSYAFFWYSTNVRFHNNTSHETLYIMSGDMVRIEDNTFRDEAGVMSYPILNITIFRNTFESGYINILLTASHTNFDDYAIEIIGNSIQDHPILYYRDANNIEVPENAGQVIMVDCTAMSMIVTTDSGHLRSVLVIRSRSVVVSGFNLQPGGHIILEDSEDIDIINCTFTNASTGVTVGGSSNVVVGHCLFENSTLSATYSGDNFRVDDCEFRGTVGSKTWGLYTSGNVTIVDSIISGFKYGIQITGDESLIERCTIRNNTNGISFSKGEHVVIDCAIYNNPDGGISVGGTYGDDNDDNITIDARYNYWGSANGPYHPTENPAGWGDEVADGVVFSDWHETEDFTPFGGVGDGARTGGDGGGDDDDNDNPIANPMYLMIAVIIGVGILLAIGVIVSQHR